MKERKGYEWRETPSGAGYWSKIDENARHKHKLDFFCPHCRRPTGTIDDKCLQEYGFCKLCYTLHVEEKQVPTINLEYYKSLKSKK